MANERLNPSLQEVLDIAHGGTGANTAEQALANLGAASKAELDALSGHTYAFCKAQYVPGSQTSVTFTFQSAAVYRFGIFALYVPNGDLAQSKAGGIFFNHTQIYSKEFTVSGDKTSFTISGLQSYGYVTIFSSYEMN